ncbi:DMT family transporter [Candidatus Thorarchaeota archaeon]|nr:MAG: DMT family transporter [Candidatus Thorarchaeota archaeon]
MTISIIDESTSKLKVVLLLVLSVSMVSSASILVLTSTSPSLVKVFWRTLYGSLFMTLIGAARGDFSALRTPTVRNNLHWLAGIGVILSLHFSTWFQSLEMTSIAASVVLVDSSPIFTAIFSTIFLGESIRRRSWAGILIAVTGAVFLAWVDYGGLDFGALSGDLLALSGALFLAIYFIGGRKYAKGMPITVYTSIVYLFAAITTLFLCIPFGYDVLVFDPLEILIFIGLAIFPTVLGHSVNNYLLTKVPAYVVSAAVLGEPIGATLLGALVFMVYPTPLVWVGFFIILLGVGVVLVDIVSKERAQISSLDDTDGSQSDCLSSNTNSI